MTPPSSSSLLSSSDLSEEQRQLLERAAESRGDAVKEFVLNAVLEEAERVLAEEEAPAELVRIALSEKDYAAVMDAVMNPKGPSQELKDAAREYREYREQHGL
jgi:uncharacterized protein (DUF1778 family)